VKSLPLVHQLFYSTHTRKMRVVNSSDLATDNMSPSDNKVLTPLKNFPTVNSSDVISVTDSVKYSSDNIVQVKDTKESTDNIVQVKDIPSAAGLAASALLGGHVIGVPTDTIYGLAALVQNQEAVDNLYTIKERDYTKAIAICVKEIQDIDRWAEVTVDRQVLEELLPGPFTLVLERNKHLNQNLNPGNKLVGVRIPDDQFIGSVCSLVDAPIALTSANLSGASSSLAVHEFSSLHHKLHSVYDKGRLEGNSRLGSTVVDLSVEGSYTVIRRGCAGDKLEAIMQKYGIKQVI